eukprot:6202673-Pleurochrysis_carterae.AAC.1
MLAPLHGADADAQRRRGVPYQYLGRRGVKAELLQPSLLDGRARARANPAPPGRLPPPPCVPG